MRISTHAADGRTDGHALFPRDMSQKRARGPGLMQSCPRVGWTRGSGRVGSGHDFAGFWRVGSGRVGSALRIL